MKRLPLAVSFILFIALCVSLAFWGMQLFKPPVRQVAQAPQGPRAEVRIDAAASLFGGRAQNAAVASNFSLKGVVMSGSPGESVAILSADGKPAQSIREGKEAQPGVTIKEVHPHYVMLLDGGVMKRVDLPESARGQSGGGGSVAPGTAPAPAPVPGITPIQPGPAASPEGAPPVPNPANGKFEMR